MLVRMAMEINLLRKSVGIFCEKYVRMMISNTSKAIMGCAPFNFVDAASPPATLVMATHLIGFFSSLSDWIGLAVQSSQYLATIYRLKVVMLMKKSNIPSLSARRLCSRM